MKSIKSKAKPKKELKQKMRSEDYQEFFKFLGIDPKDFEEMENDVNFDDYSS